MLCQQERAQGWVSDPEARLAGLQDWWHCQPLPIDPFPQLPDQGSILLPEAFCSYKLEALPFNKQLYRPDLCNILKSHFLSAGLQTGSHRWAGPSASLNTTNNNNDSRFIELLSYTRCHAWLSAGMNPLSLCNNALRQVLLPSIFQRRENWGPESLSNLPQVTQHKASASL